MALIKCGECEREISDSAESCPGCGFKNAVQPEPADFANEYPYPGALPMITGKTLQDKFAQIGTLAGRPLSEVISVVGPPNSRGPADLGLFQCQWIVTSIWAKSYHIGLIFDSNEICGGVFHESAF